MNSRDSFSTLANCETGLMPVRSICLAIVLLASPGAHVYAENDLDFGAGYDTLGLSYTVVPVHQASTDMDAGGSVSLSSVRLRLGMLKPVARGTVMGASLSYSHIDYTFTNPLAFGGQAPWDRIRSLDFGLPVLSRIDDKWSIMVVPSIGMYGEYDAQQDDSLTYGVVLAAGYRVEPKRRIGIGVAAFDRLDQSKLFPFVSISWQLTDRLRLSNPLRAGPTGAAGLELAYSLKNDWEAGIGVARRNFRFRLDDSGAAPGGIGEQVSRLLFARLTYKLGASTRVGFYAGAVRKGTLDQRDQNGLLLAATDIDTAAMLALSLDGRF